MSKDCVFCKKIADEDLESAGDCVVFKPLNPVVEGHLLVVPRRHVDNFGFDPNVTADTMRTAVWISRRFREFNIITSKGKNASQSINHLHVHIIPRKKGDGLKLPWSKNLSNE